MCVHNIWHASIYFYSVKLKHSIIISEADLWVFCKNLQLCRFRYLHYDSTCMCRVFIRSHTKLEPEYDKTTKWPVRPAKTQISWASTNLTSLRGYPGWSEFLLCAQVTLLIFSCSGSTFIFPTHMLIQSNTDRNPYATHNSKWDENINFKKRPEKQR